MTVLQYLQSAYDISHFPFTRLPEVLNYFGEAEAKRQLNELFKDGKIKKRSGCNGILIELIIDK